MHGPLSAREEEAARQSVAFAKLMSEGPFYTGDLGDGNSAQAEPIQRYSDRYKKPKKVGTLISEYPYNLDFFPEELYSVMGVTGEKKRLLLSSYKARGGLTLFQTSKKDTEQLMLEKLKSMAEDLDATPAPEEPAEEEEEVDDDFDGEDDEDDDYNAEKYFDGGDDDMGDDDDDEAAF